MKTAVWDQKRLTVTFPVTKRQMATVLKAAAQGKNIQWTYKVQITPKVRR